MSKSSADPSGNTEQFRAFAQRQPDAAPGARSRTPLVVCGLVAALVVLAVVLVAAVG